MSKDSIASGREWGTWRTQVDVDWQSGKTHDCQAPNPSLPKRAKKAWQDKVRREGKGRAVNPGGASVECAVFSALYTHCLTACMHHNLR